MVYKRLIQVEGQVQNQNNGLSNMERDHYHLAVQVAELDTSYGEHQNRLVRVEYGLGEIARNLEFLTDYASTLHFGLVELGGFLDGSSSKSLTLSD
eukprot:s196_g21.t1